VRFGFISNLDSTNTPGEPWELLPHDWNFGFLHNPLCAVTGYLQVGVAVDYSNHSLSAWEPLVEQCQISARCLLPQPSRRLSGLTFEIEGDEMESEHSPQFWVESDGVLDINVTEALVETISGLTSAWEWAIGESDTKLTEKMLNMRPTEQKSSTETLSEVANASKSMYSLYWIHNDTGCRLLYWGEGKQLREVDPSTEEPLDIPLQSGSDENNRRTISPILSLGGGRFLPLPKVIYTNNELCMFDFYLDFHL
jgi:hypothetical protein